MECEQLPSIRGRYPVNLVFASPVLRKMAMIKLKQHCEDIGLPRPVDQFALAGFPEARSQTKNLTDLLKEIKNSDHLIERYSITSYGMFFIGQVGHTVPLFSTYANGKWTNCNFEAGGY